MGIKKIIVIAWLGVLLLAVGTLFWYNELQYQLPTPVPADYVSVQPGQLINLKGVLKADHSKPLFLHFFNPDCPCSRFNIKQFKALVNSYGHSVNFVVVVMSTKTFTVDEIQNKFDLKIPVIFDKGIAIACGVYSTPQVALLDNDDKLYYRGNYNRSRYCTDEKTSYAKTAVNGLLNDHARLTFSRLALQSYGCRLPNCTQ
jgi:hypothetical protein